MRLGVNAVRLSRPFTGVGRYLECVLAEWAEMELPFDRVTLYAPAPLRKVVFPVDRFEVVIGGGRGPDPLWERRFLRARAAEIDVLFSPSYTLPIGYPGRCAVTNLGPAENTPLTYAWWRAQAYERLYRASARRADRVFACSKSVRTRLVEVYGIPAERITVAYLAASRLFRPVRDEASLAEARRRYAGVDTPFALFVGKLARRHSIPNLIRAFARLHRAAPDHRLVVVGPDYLGIDVPRLARREGVAERVVHHPFVEHPDLPLLFSAAEEVVYPATHAEGFGLPVIEAMACGTPVVSVRQGSIPEVSDGAACLVPTSSVDDLERGLAAVVGDAALRRRLSEAGLRRASQITWRFTAERILRDLAAIAGSGGREGGGG